MSCYMGIDPGKSGGICVVDQKGRCLLSAKMPGTEVDILETMGLLEVSSACIERVHSTPQMGVCSAHTFGRGYGALLMACAALGIRVTEVAPGTWQRKMGCLTRGNKNVTKRRAQQLFPDVKVTHAIADALLIADYCRRMRSL